MRVLLRNVEAEYEGEHCRGVRCYYECDMLREMQLRRLECGQ